MVKMKLAPTEKVMREEYLEQLEKNDGWIFTDYPNGVTYCFMPEFPGSKMMSMSLAVCNEKDRFSRKYGEFVALDRMYMGDNYLVPQSMIYYERRYVSVDTADVDYLIPKGLNVKMY